MKKIFLLLSIILTLGVVINSCISEKVIEIIETPDPTPPGPTPPDPNEKKIIKVSTTIETTSLYKRNMANDKIGLFIYNNNDAIESNYPLTLAAGNGQFEISTDHSNGYCYGYYPYSSLSINSVYSGAVFVEQNQHVSTSINVVDLQKSLADQLLMISNQSLNVDFNGQQSAAIQFKNIFSLLRFHIKRDAGFTNFTNQKLKKFEVYISNKTDTLTPLPSYKLAGEYSIDFRTATYLGDLTPVFSSAYSPIIKADVPNNPMITDNVNLVAWVVVPPLLIASSDNLVFKLETEDDNGISYTSTHTFAGLGRINRNELKEFFVVITKDNAVTDDVVNESFADRPANSYIISEPGIYEIATKKVKGEALSGSSVDWLWASVAGGGAPSVANINDMFSIISYDQGLIKFRVGNKSKSLKEGNVILALKDASNRILWTWHIWITDNPQDVVYGNGKRFMDRNMGALSSVYISPGVDNYGFVYQWGRKDAFFGGNGLVNEAAGTYPAFSVAENNTVINNSAAWESNANRWTQIHTTGGNSEMATMYPMLFICNNDNTLPADKPLDWLSQSNPNRWSDIEKTDNDPCPYGYKVPSKGDLSPLFEMEADNITPKNFKRRQNKYWEYSSLVNISMWPAAGMRQGRSYTNNNYGSQLLYSGTSSSVGQCIYWTSSQINVGGITLTGGSHRIYTTNGVPNYTIYKDDYGDNADAYPVRCVKIP